MGRTSLLFSMEMIGKGIGGFAAISMKSVAGFMVDAAEKVDWDGSSPVIAN